jgi:hypothetical protein
MERKAATAVEKKNRGARRSRGFNVLTKRPRFALADLERLCAEAA